MADCILIGGGLMGMLTARYLHEAGARVLLLERGRLGGEASWASGGILCPLYPWRHPAAVNRMAAVSQSMYPQLAEILTAETGIDPQWTQSGMLVLDVDERPPAMRWRADHNIQVTVLDRQEIHACEPALAPVFEQSLWLPDIAQIRSPRLVKALRSSLSVRNVDYREGVEVLCLRVRGGALTGVETSSGAFNAARVLITAGAWSARLIPPNFAPVAVQPVRGQIIVLNAPQGLVRRIVLCRGDYLIPRKDGRVLVGSTLEDSGFDNSTTVAAREELVAKATAWVPALRNYPIEHHWSGLRPGSPAGIPYVGEHPELHGLFLNTGHFRCGLALGPASARLAADLVLQRPPVLAPEAYSLSAARAEY
ncbi:MAG: glycine oxidase ThiO [Gammaproteobacteria bacterium]|nr:glycine oxidase ThiO [Gammaproteobacteria bacterium]MBA3731789.1 glycine oxidase ThiO [Gammaproteobacteria bacterium]